MAARWIMCVIGGPANGRKMVLEPDSSITIGRAPGCDFSLGDAGMAGEHCKLSYDGEQLTLHAHDSESGTLLQGAPVEDTAELSHGDWVRAGGSELVVYQEGHSSRLLRKGQTPHEASQAALSVLRQEQPLYALVDAAPDPTVLQLLRETTAAVQCLFDEPEATALAYLSPYVVSLPAGCEALEVLVELGWGKQWAVYLTYPRPMTRLRTQLQQTLSTEAPSADLADDAGQLRFYDPRVLLAYLAQCDGRQRALLYGDIEVFVAEDAAGVPQRLTR